MKILFYSILILFTGISYATAQKVTTLSGGAKEGIASDGDAFLDAKYSAPWGMAYDSHNNLYIVDAGNNGIVYIINNKSYKRGGYYTGGYKDGGGVGGSLMAFPNGIVTGANDTVFFTDYYNNAIRRMNPFNSIGKSQVVTTIAGGGSPTTGGNGESGYKDGMGLNARFSYPSGIVISPDFKYLLVADIFNAVIRKVSLSGNNYGEVTTYAGDESKNGHQASDGTLLKAVFSYPVSLCITPTGDVYVADLGGGIRLISGNDVTTIIQSNKIENPTTLAYSDNYLYIGNGCNIKRYNFKTKALTVLAGSENFITCGYKNASDTLARFNTINGVMLSSDKKSLLVSDSNSIRQIELPVVTFVNPVTNEETGIVVYPNPANDLVNIRIEGKRQGSTTIQLLDINGRTLKETVISGSMSQSQMDVSTIKAGAYILRISNGQFSTSTGLILSK